MTSAVVEAAERKYLDGKDLAAWAEALINAGYDSDAIIEAVGNPDMHWQKVPPLFARICCDLGLSNDIYAEIARIKECVRIEEYRVGQATAAQLIFGMDDFRKRIGFPEQLMLVIQPDNRDGTNDSGYETLHSGLRGPALEAALCKLLENAGITPYSKG